MLPRRYVKTHSAFLQLHTHEDLNLRFIISDHDKSRHMKDVHPPTCAYFHFKYSSCMHLKYFDTSTPNNSDLIQYEKRPPSFSVIYLCSLKPMLLLNITCMLHRIHSGNVIATLNKNQSILNPFFCESDCFHLLHLQCHSHVTPPAIFGSESWMGGVHLSDSICQLSDSICQLSEPW